MKIALDANNSLRSGERQFHQGSFFGRVLYKVHYVEHFETLCQCLQDVPDLSSKLLINIDIMSQNVQHISGPYKVLCRKKNPDAHLTLKN